MKTALFYSTHLFFNIIFFHVDAFNQILLHDFACKVVHQSTIVLPSFSEEMKTACKKILKHKKIATNTIFFYLCFYEYLCIQSSIF